MNAKLFAIFLFLSIISSISVSAVTTPTLQMPPIKTANKINLNTASIKELTNSVKGIGEKRANSIIEYRKANGKFKSISELAQVKGLGKSFVKKYLSVLQNKFTVE